MHIYLLGKPFCSSFPFINFLSNFGHFNIRLRFAPMPCSRVSFNQAVFCEFFTTSPRGLHFDNLFSRQEKTLQKMRISFDDQCPIFDIYLMTIFEQVYMIQNWHISKLNNWHMSKLRNWHMSKSKNWHVKIK